MKRMMTLSRAFLKTVSALALFFVTFSTAINELQFENRNVNISWNYVSASQEIDFNVSVRTTGYVAMGVTKTNSDMQNLALFAGGVDSSGKSYLKDYYATGTGTPLPEGKQNFTLINATEANGVTTVCCRTKLNTQDGEGQVIQPGDEIYIAWAYHTSSDNLTTHSSKGYSSEKHVLVPGNAPSSGNTPTSETPTTSQTPPAPAAKAPAVMPTSVIVTILYLVYTWIAD